MRVEKLNADEWWCGTGSELRTFCRDVIKLVEDITAEEVLELRFNGRNFSPMLFSKRRLAADIEAGVEGECPETWWSELSHSQRTFVQQLVSFVTELQRDHNKVLEIRNSGE